MGIRYEKDTILNWINEMGKFLRLLVDKWEGIDNAIEQQEIEAGYREFFQKDKAFFVDAKDVDLEVYLGPLEPEQIRPLAQFLMYDGLLNQDKNLLQKAKFLFESQMRITGSFSFEDYGFLAQIDQAIK